VKTFTGDPRTDTAIASAGGYEPRRPGIRGSVVPTDTGPDWTPHQWLSAATKRLDQLSALSRRLIEAGTALTNEDEIADWARAVAVTADDARRVAQIIVDQTRMLAAERGLFFSLPPDRQ
jgi:hypothetical protein